jgi:pimeloyl-ACP methyl ester carboxylesterase
MTVHDSIDLTHVAPTGSSHDSLLVFFITGNPGLIEYYRTFLTLCFDSLRTSYSDHHITVAGTSLRGFGVQDHDHHRPADDNAEGPYDLEQQIEHIGRMLERAIESHARHGSSPKVVLMGHSVGSYILLEVLRRRKQSPTTQQLSNDAKVIGGICLFPTVTHIAKSPSGKNFSVCYLVPTIIIRETTVYPQFSASIYYLTHQLTCVFAVVLCHSVLCCYCRRDCTSIVLLGSFHCATNPCWPHYWIPCFGRRAHDCIYSKSRRCQASIASSQVSLPDSIYI